MRDDLASLINVEVAAAWPAQQTLVVLQLPAGSSAADALRAAGFPAAADIGIFGRRVRPSQSLADGDRVEIYRPLVRDPKQARRHRSSGSKA